MKKFTDKNGMLKDYLKGIIVGVLALVAIIVAIVLLNDPNSVIISIILFGVGIGAAGTAWGLIRHARLLNTHRIDEDSSDYSSSDSSNTGKRFRKPEKPSESSEERRVSHSQVVKAVRYLGCGQIYVTDCSVYETYPNEFSIELTLVNKTGESDMAEAHAREVMDRAKRAVEDLGASASISAHF